MVFFKRKSKEKRFESTLSFLWGGGANFRILVTIKSGGAKDTKDFFLFAENNGPKAPPYYEKLKINLKLPYL
jgi:hypothetical protein